MWQAQLSNCVKFKILSREDVIFKPFDKSDEIDNYLSLESSLYCIYKWSQGDTCDLFFKKQGKIRIWSVKLVKVSFFILPK